MGEAGREHGADDVRVAGEVGCRGGLEKHRGGLEKHRVRARRNTRHEVARVERDVNTVRATHAYVVDDGRVDLAGGDDVVGPVRV